jgi:methyl-accepting chemotaxis protein
MFLLVCTSVLGLTGLAGLGYTQIDRVFAAANFNTVNTLPSVFLLNDISTELFKMRLHIWHHLMQSEKAVMQEDEQNIDSVRFNTEKLLKDYELLIADAEDKQLLENDRNSLKFFDNFVTKVLETSTANKKTEARDMLQNNQEILDKIFQDLSKHVAYNARQGKQSSDAALQIQASALNLSLAVALLSMLVTSCIGFIITRKLQRQLGGEPDCVVDLANKIALGNLNTSIDLKTGDNNSIMAAMKNMVSAIQGLVTDAGLIVDAAVSGRLDTRLDATKHQGDFRKIVNGINQTLDTVIGPLTEVRGLLVGMEHGDISRQINGKYQGQLEELVNAANNSVTKLSQTISQVINAAGELTNASVQISATSQALSQSASQQAAGVDEASASIEQMAASINQNAENAKVTEGMATKASKEALAGGEAVQHTVTAMKQIAGKIGIIDDIAYQTNMLALNAAIEAARAGDHGKGFAVVAAEVRKLAERSQIAAQEIGELAESSVKTAESAGELLNEIVPSIAKTSDLVQEIAAASLEQSAGVNQVNNAMNQMNQITQQNASASEQLAATAEEMTGQSEQLQQLMAFFKLSGFESPIKTAPALLSKKPPIKYETRSKPQPKKRSVAGEFDLSQFVRY